jgi:hypothetical protein
MPLAGGPADKLGNRYELWWTVLQLVEMVQGGSDAIRIEDPQADKVEFVVHRGSQCEMHQAKTGEKWTLVWHPPRRGMCACLVEEGLSHLGMARHSDMLPVPELLA